MARKHQDSMESTQPIPSNDGGVYEIKIKECLDDHWKEWFEGMDLKRVENSELRQLCTVIIGPIADQSALHGLLAKIRDLNLTFISVRNITPEAWQKCGRSSVLPTGAVHTRQKAQPDRI